MYYYYHHITLLHITVTQYITYYSANTMTTDIIDVQCFFTPHRTKHFEQLLESDNCTFEKPSILDYPNPRRRAKIIKADRQTIILNPSNNFC